MEGRWGLPIADHIMLLRLKREAANREAAKLNDLHEAEIALARANLVNCDIATEAAKKALLVEISKFSFDSSDAESDALRDTLRAGIFANTFVACPCWPPGLWRQVGVRQHRPLLPLSEHLRRAGGFPQQRLLFPPSAPQKLRRQCIRTLPSWHSSGLGRQSYLLSPFLPP